MSGTGDDTFPCSRTAPCKTFAVAMAATASLGEINCLDSGGFGTVSITKQITIDCTGVIGGIANGGATGVTINIAGGAVTLRGLTINGGGTGTVGVRITAASKVNLENVEVYGNTQQGVLDARTSGGTILVIENSTIRNNTLAGISTTATSASGVILDKVISKQNQYGVAVANGQTTIIRGSMFSNNGTGNRSGCYRPDPHHRQHDGLQRNGRADQRHCDDGEQFRGEQYHRTRRRRHHHLVRQQPRYCKWVAGAGDGGGWSRQHRPGQK